MHRGAREHVAAPTEVPGKTEVQKQRSAITVILEYSLELLGRNERLFLRRRTEWKEELVFFRYFAHRVAIPRTNSFPMQIFHHLIDVGSDIRAKVELIGMLVKIEHQDRNSAWKAMRMARNRLLIDPGAQTTPASPSLHRRPAFWPSC